ncbi:Uncharacterised protein [Serratia fonticola]|nr:Uncharacterised protein [Serratia fonticola]
MNKLVELVFLNKGTNDFFRFCRICQRHDL